MELTVLESRSLKEKRMVVRRIKDRVRQRLSLPVAEVGALDLWQRAVLGIAVAGGERATVQRLLEQAWRCVAATEGIELVGSSLDVAPFAGADASFARGEDEGDGAGAALDASWAPAQWQELLDEESR
jgi:uncharacterized protein